MGALPIRARSVFAAAAPHGHSFESCMQRCRPSGASIPNNRTRVAPMSTESPSTTFAVPLMISGCFAHSAAVGAVAASNRSRAFRMAVPLAKRPEW
jgi:hypothetical protein